MGQSSEVRQWVFAWIKGDINQKDREYLEMWLAENPDNQEWFDRYVQKEQLSKSLQLYSSFHTDRKWNELERQLLLRSGRFTMRRLLAYAAILVIVFMSGVAYWWLYDTGHTSSVIAHLNKECRNQAILVVEDGQQIVLNGIRDTCLLVGKKERLNINTEGNLVYSEDTSGLQQQEIWHTVRVPEGGEYKLVLNDGTEVWLNSASEFSFPIHFSGPERKVKLSGEAYFQVTENKEKAFVVDLGKQEVKVLGTSFDVTAYPDECCIYTTLLTGSVLVTEGSNSEILTPGEQAVFNGKEFTVRKVNATLYCSWIRDRFVFASENLETVARKLERWYDVQFFFTGESLKAELFTGSIPKYTELSKVLKMLEMTTSIRFSQKGQTVVVEAIQ